MPILTEFLKVFLLAQINLKKDQKQILN